MWFRLTAPVAIVLIGGVLYSQPPADPAGPAVPGFDQPVTLLGGADYHGGAPAFADLDGDGLTDLVVGTSDGDRPERGRLLVYRNRGTAGRPAYAKPTWLDQSVPSARIPDG